MTDTEDTQEQFIVGLEQMVADLSRRLVEEREAKARIVESHNKLANEWIRERDLAIARARDATEKLAVSDAENDRLRKRIHEAVDEANRRFAPYVSRCDKLDALAEWVRKAPELRGMSEAVRTLVKSLKEENDDLLEKLQLAQELVVDRLDAVGQRASLRARVTELVAQVVGLEEERDRLRAVVDGVTSTDGKLEAAVARAEASQARAQELQNRVGDQDKLLAFCRQERDKAEQKLKAIRRFILADEE